MVTQKDAADYAVTIVFQIDMAHCMRRFGQQRYRQASGQAVPCIGQDYRQHDTLALRHGGGQLCVDLRCRCFGQDDIEADGAWLGFREFVNQIRMLVA